MKISQLVSSKNKMPYYESIASRLPRGVKSQQHLLNLGYSVAVHDLGLLKAKTLDENFAAKLINSYHTQCLEEGIGSFLGKAAGNVVGGAQAAGRGIKGAWNDAKKGYADAKASWGAKADTDTATATPGTGGAAPTATATPGTGGAALTATATPGTGGTTGGAAQGGTAGAGGISRPYVASPDAAGAPSAAGAAPAGGAPAGGAAPSAGGAAPSTAGNISDIMKTIDALDRPGKEQLAGELEKSIAGGEKPAPAAPGATPPAGAEPPNAATPAGVASTPTQGSTYDSQAGKTPSAPGNRQKGDMVQAGANQLQYTGEPGKEWFVASGPLQQPNPQADKFNNIQAVGGKKFISAADAKRNLQVAERRRMKKNAIAEFHSKFLGRTI